MAKPKKSLEAVIQAARDTLAEEAESGATLCLAMWSEADADAGYLVHVDGRMVGVGEYQYGFSSIDDMARDHGDDETNKWARSEAGRLAGSLEALDEEGIEMLNETFQYAFGKDADKVEQALNANAHTIEELFDLLTSAPHPFLVDGSRGSYEFEATRDIECSRLAVGADGKLSWTSSVAVEKGATIKGNEIRNDNFTFIEAEGGTLRVPADALENERFVPPVHRHHP